MDMQDDGKIPLKDNKHKRAFYEWQAITCRKKSYLKIIMWLLFSKVVSIPIDTKKYKNAL